MSENRGKESGGEGRPTASLESRYWTITLVVGFYFLCSLSLVFLNKNLLSGFSNVTGPYFITWVQCVFTTIFGALFGWLGTMNSNFSFIPEYEFDTTIAWQLLPASVINILMIILNNLCLKYVQITFYQIARSLTVFFNIGLSYALEGKTTSWNAFKMCLVVVLGFLLGNRGEPQFSMIGLIFGICSSAAVALNAIICKRSINLVGGHEWKLLGYQSTTQIFLLFPLILWSGELDTLYDYPGGEATAFWMTVALSGVFGFLIVIATTLQIKHTSSLTHNLVGTAKAGVQSLLSIMLGAEATIMNVCGIFLTLIGSYMYAKVRKQEMEENEARNKASPSGNV